VTDEFEDVLLHPGDEELIDRAINAAVAAGVTEQEITTVLESEPHDALWVPVAAGRIGELARRCRLKDQPQAPPLLFDLELDELSD
jgi:hypothetical protein